jgi:hypothetical protein
VLGSGRSTRDWDLSLAVGPDRRSERSGILLSKPDGGRVGDDFFFATSSFTAAETFFTCANRGANARCDTVVAVVGGNGCGLGGDATSSSSVRDK